MFWGLLFSGALRCVTGWVVPAYRGSLVVSSVRVEATMKVDRSGYINTYGRVTGDRLSERFSARRTGCVFVKQWQVVASSRYDAVCLHYQPFPTSGACVWIFLILVVFLSCPIRFRDRGFIYVINSSFSVI